VGENTGKTFLSVVSALLLELQDIMEVFVNFTRVFLRALVEFCRAAVNPKLLEKFTSYRRSLCSSFSSRRLYF